MVLGLLIIAATLAGARVSESLDLLRFPLCWAGVLVALDGAARRRHGRSPLFLSDFAASIVFWDVFELVNLRLRNWWYTGVAPDALSGALFSAASFATVLPAVRLALFVLHPATPRARHRFARAPLLLAGALMLALALAVPRYAFPFAWIFLWPLCEALTPEGPGLPTPLAAGDGHVVRLLALGLPLGLIWEALNWGCARGWVYTVPFFERPKLFEMPLPGYLGYLPFLLECGAALALLDRLRPHLRGGRAVAALVCVAALHLGADAAARGRTDASHTPLLSELRGVPRDELDALAARGVRTPKEALRLGAPPLVLRAARLEVATHMGVRRAELYGALTGGVEGLARADAAELAARAGDPPALVRLWIAKARGDAAGGSW